MNKQDKRHLPKMHTQVVTMNWNRFVILFVLGFLSITKDLNSANEWTQLYIYVVGLYSLTSLHSNYLYHAWLIHLLTPWKRTLCGMPLVVCEAMYAVFHSNFAAYIVCWRCKPCEFLGLIWPDCWDNKSYYVINSPANCHLVLYTGVVRKTKERI